MKAVDDFAERPMPTTRIQQETNAQTRRTVDSCVVLPAAHHRSPHQFWIPILRLRTFITTMLVPQKKNGDISNRISKRRSARGSSIHVVEETTASSLSIRHSTSVPVPIHVISSLSNSTELAGSQPLFLYTQRCLRRVTLCFFTRIGYTETALFSGCPSSIRREFRTA